MRLVRLFIAAITGFVIGTFPTDQVVDTLVERRKNDPWAQRRPALLRRGAEASAITGKATGAAVAGGRIAGRYGVALAAGASIAGHLTPSSVVLDRARRRRAAATGGGTSGAAPREAAPRKAARSAAAPFDVGPSEAGQAGTGSQSRSDRASATLRRLRGSQP